MHMRLIRNQCAGGAASVPPRGGLRADVPRSTTPPEIDIDSPCWGGLRTWAEKSDRKAGGENQQEWAGVGG